MATNQVKETRIRQLAVDIGVARKQQAFSRASIDRARREKARQQSEIRFLTDKSVAKKERDVRKQFLPAARRGINNSNLEIARLMKNNLRINNREEKLVGQFQSLTRGARQNLLSK